MIIEVYGSAPPPGHWFPRNAEDTSLGSAIVRPINAIIDRKVEGDSSSQADTTRSHDSSDGRRHSLVSILDNSDSQVGEFEFEISLYSSPPRATLTDLPRKEEWAMLPDACAQRFARCVLCITKMESKYYPLSAVSLRGVTLCLHNFILPCIARQACTSLVDAVKTMALSSNTDSSLYQSTAYYCRQHRDYQDSASQYRAARLPYGRFG